MNRFLVTSAAATLALAALATGAWAQKTELLVYTALETDQLKAYTESFQKTNPNIDLKFVRDSTGVITAKVLAEKANPQADVIIGVSATSSTAKVAPATKRTARTGATLVRRENTTKRAPRQTVAPQSTRATPARSVKGPPSTAPRSVPTPWAATTRSTRSIGSASKIAATP